MLPPFFREETHCTHWREGYVDTSTGKDKAQKGKYRASTRNRLLSRPAHNLGRAVAQAVSNRIATTAARVLAQVTSCGIYGGRSGTGAGFLLVFRFQLPIFPPTTPYSSSSIIRRWYKQAKYLPTCQVELVSPKPSRYSD
jgi:hypothetical protein